MPPLIAIIGAPLVAAGVGAGTAATVATVATEVVVSTAATGLLAEATRPRPPAQQPYSAPDQDPSDNIY